MKNIDAKLNISKTEAKLFASVITVNKVREHIAAHPAEYASFVAENAKKQAEEAKFSKGRRISRKVAQK